MKRILREPLLHFLLLGAVLFLTYGLVAGSRGAAPDTIIVTAAQVAQLASGFVNTWRRPPSEAELKSLIDDWVREEIATREALALGLDKDDTIIRRRLRQKLEYVSDDITAYAEPADADLKVYLQTHPELFRVEPRVTFRQVYLDPAKHDGHLMRDAEQLLAQLNKSGGKAEISTLGDSLLLEQEFRSIPTSEVGKQFGDEFAAAVVALPAGRWQGPVESGYGVHLVLVGERVEGRLPELAEVRDVVVREWTNARRLEASATMYRELLKRYEVKVEGLRPDKIVSP